MDSCIDRVWRVLKRWSILLALLPVGVVLTLLWRYPPGTVSFWPRCQIQKLTGLYCPGCGMTRALARLVRGDVLGSLSYNVLLIPFVCLLVALFFSARLRQNGDLAWKMCIFLLVFTVLRNLPWYPFVLLAP